MAVIRLGNGMTAQVRVGVLQGVGPTGPKGPKGDRGIDGPMGPEGPVGPAGSLSELLSVATINPQTVSAGQEAWLSFVNVERDDFSIFASATNLVPADIGGVYVVNVFAILEKPANAADGRRYLHIVEDGPTDSILGADGVAPSPDGQTILSASAIFEAKADCVYKVRVGNTDDLGITMSAARISINRIGAGPAGPTGPDGPQGVPGPQGAAGPTGPAGNANSGFTTFEDLRPE